MATQLEQQLMHPVCEEMSEFSQTKVTVVGVGQVGMACAFSILTQHVASELALVDVVADKLHGEVKDLQHGLAFTKGMIVKGDTDYKVSAGSRLCIVTAGVRQREGESRLNLVQRNVAIFKGIIPNLVKYSPNTIIMVVSNPVDILTYVAWRLSGLPKNRVFGSGTNLDTARFRFLIGEKLQIAPSSVHGYIIGEHGDTSVPVWSGTSIAGVSLVGLIPQIGTDRDMDEWKDLHKDVVESPKQGEAKETKGIGLEGESLGSLADWKTLHKRVVDSAYEIIRLKGYTSWAIGLSVSTLAQSVLRNQNAVFALTTLAQGYHGIEKDVFLSLPCVLGEHGVRHVIKQQLNPQEVQQLRNSAETLADVIKELQLPAPTLE
ncbi:L-lactate dehydrogenase-like isoform X1 [Asterias rubens]|uniref:L-lactate dehydrogenase-like isoform X1 n=1 Tax=Asterias rubens TaxID=7604 RepID=UPI0014559B2C|nr:L-lactate dehydrogenase-like isoform X1 [Asterias rubens]